MHKLKQIGSISTLILICGAVGVALFITLILIIDLLHTSDKEIKKREESRVKNAVYNQFLERTCELKIAIIPGVAAFASCDDKIYQCFSTGQNCTPTR